MYLAINIIMTKDSHLMFERYVEGLKAKLVKESILPFPPGTKSGSWGPEKDNPSDEPALTNTKEAEEKANSKRLVEILDGLKTDANLATKFALTPEEFVSVIEWAKKKFTSESPKPDMGGPLTTKPVGEGVVSEKKKENAKDEDNMEVVKPSSEETEEEYLARRDAAIKASIAAKEESEEQAAMNSHYNTNHEALDLVHSLINHPKKYTKADAIKILALASDKLQNKA